MSKSERVRFWQPAPAAGTDFMAAYLAAGSPSSHLHAEWQFAVPEQPSGLALDAYRRHAVRPDEVTVVPPFTVHSEGGSLGPAPHWWLLFVAAEVVTDRIGLDARAIARFPGQVLADAALAGQLRELLRQSAAGLIDDAELDRSALVWLQKVLRPPSAAPIFISRSAAVERARALLHRAPTETIRLPELAAAAGTSVAHLVRTFARSVGMPPLRYHAQVRLAHARRRLAEGYPVGRVAYECGFADQSHLQRRFKQCYGLAPGIFQAQYRTAAGQSGATAA